mgnify:FL=1
MNDILSQFLGQEAGPIVQFIKYGIAGAIATAVHILMFHLLAWRAFPALQQRDLLVRVLKLNVAPIDDRHRSRNSMIDNFGAFIVSNFVCYLINISWVFQAGRHHWAVELGLFYLASGFATVLGTALMGWLIRRFGLLTTYAFGANILTSVMVNYAVRKFIIFHG